MKKKLIGTVVFLALAAGLLWKLNDAFRLKPGTIDVMFYGSSHTYSDINPAVLWDQEGISSYDLAGSLQPLWNTYYYMKESLKYQTPKVMVVELVRVIESRDYIEEARTVTNTFGMKFSKEKIENIQVSTPDNLIPYLLGYPVYHSRYTELSRVDFAAYLGDPHGKASKGYYPLYVTKSYDSMADMSEITESSDLAPKSEEYLRKIIALAKEEDIPLVFMTYLNPVFHYGYEPFFTKCEEVGINGIIIPDMPYEEKGELNDIARSHQVDVISLIAPTSEQRIQKIAADAEGFIYLVSSLGVTGVRSEIKTDLDSMIAAIRKVTDIPVAVGFGINTTDQAANIAKIADGVIVGSAIVKMIAKYGTHAEQHIYTYVRMMKEAVMTANK